MTFDVKEEDEKIIVFVEVPHATRNSVPKIPRVLIQTKDIIQELKERGISHGKVLRETDEIHSWERHLTKGTWIFEKKGLDKPAEKVILSKENKPAPKKRKSRAKKKTSK
jgi:hypothetical protein